VPENYNNNDQQVNTQDFLTHIDRLEIKAILWFVI